jgi:hypothetical protein
LKYKTKSIKIKKKNYEKRAITPRWVIKFTLKLQGRKILTCCKFLQFKRLCKLEKRGDEIKKKSSLKLLSHSQPNFAEMILGWSSSKIVSVISEHRPISSLCLYSSNLGTFWLKIEQFWPFEEISIFSNGGHLGYRTALTDTILKGDHLKIISAKFG